VNVKGELGLLPASWAKSILRTIDETQKLLAEMEQQLESDGCLSPDIKDVIRAYNRKILAYSSDQIIPVPRPFGGRWYDDFTVPAGLIEDCSAGNGTAVAA
jgi:clorobiocin biosynthesis protein CloN6